MKVSCKRKEAYAERPRPYMWLEGAERANRSSRSHDEVGSLNARAGLCHSMAFRKVMYVA